eukprot:Plantae.Rhodophyta-Purpureofilum_apyrenoidigerum.ctg15821.p1 GENE.Plantae.Rhodophyta-Purpureofilum_apyrenoidigerum.ctg15821~~Plantae.Rhodophyta-Purpureofilum_apyrenoidigerum.ctg15821.p1  ORF type:complete len:465 (-),score=88.49 Plantae.Rhodophyta-Purpureofilum_apyrenoidigerum.ctg15821:260-1654(-)
MRRSESFNLDEAADRTVYPRDEPASVLNLRRRKRTVGIPSMLSYENGTLEREEKSQSMQLTDMVIDGEVIVTSAQANPRREMVLDCLEIWPDGNRKAQKVTRSYVLNLANAAEEVPPDMATSMFKDRKAARELRRALRQQIGNGLQLRDFRQIDPAFLGKPALWVRRNAIVVSLEEIRAIILHNRCFLFNESALTHWQVDLIFSRMKEGKETSDVVEGGFQQFEFSTLEGLLLALTCRLERDYNSLEKDIVSWTDSLTKVLMTPVMEGFRSRKSSLNRMLSKFQHVETVFDALLDCDEDMASMYLTDIHQNPGCNRSPLDHEEVEMLLENYLQVIDFLSSKGRVLLESIDDAESLVEMRLDALQNRLLLVDLFISAITVVFTFGSAVSGVFGMNLPLPSTVKDLPSSKYIFGGVVIGTLVIMSVILLSIFMWLAKEGIYSFKFRSAFKTHRRLKTVVRHTLHTD